MSHITSIDIQIRCLDALRGAVKELCKGTVVAATTFMCYQTRRGMPQHCDFAISVPGCTDQVGLTKQKDGSYTLAFDFYGQGAGLRTAFGEKLSVLAQMYGVHKATNEANARGLHVERELVEETGAIRLSITGGGEW